MAIHAPAAGAQPKLVLEADSYVLLGLSCIPVVGMLISQIYQRSLSVVAEKEKDGPRLIEVINLKNNYKMAHIVSLVVTVAAILVSLEFSLFWTGVTCFCLTATVIDKIAKNKSLVAELQTSGYRAEIGSEVC